MCRDIIYTVKRMAVFLMYRILEKKDLNNEVVYMKVDAPAVAKKVRARTIHHTSSK